jgi:hypothetical protein
MYFKIGVGTAQTADQHKKREVELFCITQKIPMNCEVTGDNQ